MPSLLARTAVGVLVVVGTSPGIGTALCLSGCCYFNASNNIVSSSLLPCLMEKGEKLVQSDYFARISRHEFVTYIVPVDLESIEWADVKRLTNVCSIWWQTEGNHSLCRCFMNEFQFVVR